MVGLAGDLLEFTETAEALEYHQSRHVAEASATLGIGGN